MTKIAGTKSGCKSNLNEEIFKEKLEKLVGQKTINNKRVIFLAESTLRETGASGDVFLDYFPSIGRAFQIAEEFFSKKGYVQMNRGYCVQKQPNIL